jgi:glycine cleavage system H lipoate-binding protein
MKKTYGALLLASMLTLTLSGASHLNKSQNTTQAITFEQRIGGHEADVAKSVIVLDDGYLIVGQSKSFSKNRFFDIYVIKIDKNGKKVWSKHLGTKEDEEGNSVIEVDDGFVIVGSSDKLGNDRKSVYLVKISKNGEFVWERAYYSYKYDYYKGNDVIERDNGFMIAATERHPKLFDEQVDVYILSTTKKGQVVGKRRFGGEEEDEANAIINTSGGYIMAGATESFGHGDFDAYVLKMDTKGNRLWSRAFGGSDDDIANDIIEVSDGYMLVGTTESFGRRYKDVFVVKMNKKGNRIWQKAYGGTKDEEGYSIIEDNGGYVIAGKSGSYGESFRSDMYLFKIDKNGGLLWERVFGKKQDDAGYDLAATKDGYIVVGEIEDERTHDSDVYIVKTDKNGRVE